MLCRSAPGAQGPIGYGSTMPTLARIAVTPVKSLALSHPERASLERDGLPADRLFFLVDARGRPFTGAEHGPLVRIRPIYDAPADRLELRFPDGAVVGGVAGLTGDPIVCDFYGRPVSAHLVEGPWNDALSRSVGAPIRLARCDRAGDGVDVHHVTLVSRASVDEVARRGDHVGGALDARRFRMNLELDGCAPHEEDGWDGSLVRIGAAVLRLYGQVPRCVVTTQSPQTGLKDFDTLKTIAGYRRSEGGRPRLPFGMYAEVERPGTIATGDEVEPLD